MALCAEIKRHHHKDIAMNLLRRHAISSHFATVFFVHREQRFIARNSHTLARPALGYSRTPNQIKSTLSSLFDISHHPGRVHWPCLPLQRTRFTILLLRWFLQRAAHMATNSLHPNGAVLCRTFHCPQARSFSFSLRHAACSVTYDCAVSFSPFTTGSLLCGWSENQKSRCLEHFEYVRIMAIQRIERVSCAQVAAYVVLSISPLTGNSSNCGPRRFGPVLVPPWFLLKKRTLSVQLNM